MAADTALEWIEGGGLSFTVPAAMLDPSVPMSSVLSARTWQEQLSADERASLRRFLPDPTASEEDVRALVAALFGDGDGDGGGDTHVNMHFGNPAERVWREIQARERDPEVSGAQERDRGCGAGRARVGGAAPPRARGPRGDGACWRSSATRTRTPREEATAAASPARTGFARGTDAKQPRNQIGAIASGVRRRRIRPTMKPRRAGTRSPRRRKPRARDARRDGAADAASKLAATSGGPGAMAGLRAAETAMAAAEAAAAEARRARTRLDRGRAQLAGTQRHARASFVDREGGRGAGAEKKPKVANPQQHEGRRARRAQQKI